MVVNIKLHVFIIFILVLTLVFPNIIPQEQSLHEAFENITSITNEAVETSPEQEPLMSIVDDISVEDERSGWWKHDGHSIVSYASSENELNIMSLNDSNEESDEGTESDEGSENDGESNEGSEGDESSENDGESNEGTEGDGGSENDGESNEGSEGDEGSENDGESNEGSEGDEGSENDGEPDEGTEDGEETDEDTGDSTQEIPEFSAILLPFMIALCIAMFFRK